MTIPYQAIKEHYEYLTPLIMERSNIHPKSWISPYCNDVDWLKLFTPIENYTWQVLRDFGQIPMYPQYPVDKYFLDFGNPFLQIGIECDGADFHEDKEKDRRRDTELRKLGWQLYRISGAECNRPVEEYYYNLHKHNPAVQASILGEYYHETLEGLVKALAIKYCKYKAVYVNGVCNEISIAQSCLDTRLSEVEDF